MNLTVDISKLPTDATGLTYQWYRMKDGNKSLIDGATKATYTPSTKDDMGKYIIVEVTAANYSGSVQGMTGSAVVKGDGSQIPAAPTLVSVTDDSITVSHTLSDLEFAYVEAKASLESVTWTESKTFNSLKANTEYDIYARSKATDTHEASDPSPALTVTTTKKTVNEAIRKGMEESITPYVETYDGKYHPAVKVSSGLMFINDWNVMYGESSGSWHGTVPQVKDVSDNRERYVWFEHKDNAYEPVGIPYTVKISPKSITPTISLSSTSFIYDGTAKTPAVTVKDPDGTTVLNPDTDYTVAYENNTDAGTAKVTVTEVEQGNYTWSPAVENFTINNATITVGGAFTDYTGAYDGTPHGILVDTSKIETVND